MLLGIPQEILGPIRVIEHMHRCWTEIGPTLQTLPDMVHAMVNVISLSCLQRTLMLLVRLRRMSLMILSCSSTNMAVVVCTIVVLVKLHSHSVQAM
jgi:hypothetical protein